MACLSRSLPHCPCLAIPRTPSNTLLARPPQENRQQSPPLAAQPSYRSRLRFDISGERRYLGALRMCGSLTLPLNSTSSFTESGPVPSWRLPLPLIVLSGAISITPVALSCSLVNFRLLSR